MANLNLNIPDNVFSELSNISSQLKLTPEQCLLLALNHFLRTDTVENAIEGIARSEDPSALVGFPEFKEEIGIDLQLHPLAMGELEALEPEDQMEVLSQLMERISTTEKETETTLDLILKEQPAGAIKLSGFAFGDVIYQLGQTQTVAIYHIALIEDELEEDDLDDDDELDDFEDDEEYTEEDMEESSTRG